MVAKGNGLMTTINSEQFGEICNGVWRDRAAVVRGRGLLSGEAALVRAVYWRLRKAGVKPTNKAENDSSGQTMFTYRLILDCMLELNARPHFDWVPFLKELVERYQNEVARSC